MKRHLLIAALALLTALSASAEFRWGATAGFGYQKQHFKQELINVDAGPAFAVGVVGEMMFPGIGFGVDFGLNYEMHNSKMHFGEREIWASSGYGTENSCIHLIQIPVNLRFKYTRLNGLEEKVAPFVYGGPVFNIRCGHNAVPALQYSSGSIGLQVAGGVELFQRFQIAGGYYWDMTYEAKTRKLENFSCRPQGWMVRLAYFFK